MFSSCSSSLGLLRISPFVTLTLAIYLLAFLTSLFRTFSPSSDSAPSRGPVSSEFGEGEDTEENKKGMGLESLWPVTDVHSNLGNVWKVNQDERTEEREGRLSSPRFLLRFLFFVAFCRTIVGPQR